MTAGIGSIANTGLKAAMTNMETISNNIANSNTVGFKGSTVNFADIYPAGFSSVSNSTAGFGVKVQSINQDFSLGRMSLTDRGLDLSLSNDGFFVQKEANGQVTYTRAGNLVMDQNGYFLSSKGRLQGFPAVNGQITPTGTLVDMQVNNNAIPSKGSSLVNLSLNLDASSNVPATATFNSADPTSYNYRSDTTVYDGLGNAYDMSVYYIMTANNNWNSQVMINNQSVTAGSLTFQNNGSFGSASGLNNISWTPPSGASAQTFSINYAGATQYSGTNSVTQNSQDGYPAGTPIGLNIDNNGLLNVAYSNGQTQVQGQIAVARFISPQGLAQTDDMSWFATTESGTPIIDPLASAGSITPGMLELSNVDLTEELINLMGAQHDFQANAQVTQTYNQILQTIENI